MEETPQKTRVAVMGIIVENQEMTEKLNHILHEYRDCIIGRLGVPHRERDLSVISIVLDAPADRISALSGKIGMLPGITSKVLYAKKEN